MIFRTYKLTSKSKRYFSNINSVVSKKPILKTKLKSKNKICGKNNSGKITIFHRGGGHKRKIRIINFYNEKLNGIVYNIEYDPNRNANIAAIYNPDSLSFFYIIAAENLKTGDFIKSGAEAQQKIGHSIKIKNTPIGCPIFNISTLSNNYGWISRSAGSYSILINKNNKLAKILLNSGRHKFIGISAVCTIGIVSNPLVFLKQLNKAGRSRWLGIRPTVKGIAMNPVDHPNGGGEGKKSSKRRTPWGKIMKSKKKVYNSVG